MSKSMSMKKASMSMKKASAPSKSMKVTRKTVAKIPAMTKAKAPSAKAKADKRAGRPSPNVSATAFPVGTKKKGGDGNTWEIKKAANGVQRWVKCK